MRARIIGRLRDASVFWGMIAAVGVVIGAIVQEPPRTRPPTRSCDLPGCIRYDHSPEAWARAKALERSLSRCGGIDLVDISDQGPSTDLEHKGLSIPNARIGREPVDQGD